MAYVSQEKKRMLAPAIKSVLKKYKMKASIAVRHNSTLVVNIKEGALDILECVNMRALNDTRNYDLENNTFDMELQAQRLGGHYVTVSPYWIEENYAHNPVVVSFLTELKSAMEGEDFFCHDDIQSDYFFRSHYTDINVGSYNKPYICPTARDFTPEIEMLRERAKKLNEEQKLTA